MGLSKARVIILALLSFALQPITSPNAAGAARDIARCFQACHQMRVACDDRCESICLSIFPEGGKDYVDCLYAGKTRCIEFEQEYKQICLFSKDGEPVDP